MSPLGSLFVISTWLVTTVTAARYGFEIGALNSAGGTVSGTLSVANRLTLSLRGFTYNGAGTGVNFRVGRRSVSSATPSANGVIIPDELGQTTSLRAYSNRDLFLTLPFDATDAIWFSIWSTGSGSNLGSVMIGSVTIPVPLTISRFADRSTHNVGSGAVTIINSKVISIPTFQFDGLAPATHFRVGTNASPGVDGTLVPNEDGKTDPLGRYSSLSIALRLPGTLTVYDINWISVWCSTANANFGDVMIPAANSINVPPYQGPYYGRYLGELSTLANLVSGSVYAVDSNKITLVNFNYNGEGPTTFFWIGTTGTPNSSGQVVGDENGNTITKLGAYVNQTITLTLPAGVALSTVRWLSVWCRGAGADFGSLVFPTAFTIPAVKTISAINSIVHNISSGPIQIVDSKTILLPNFHYDGTGPSTWFFVGVHAMHGVEGVQLDNENGGSNSLIEYRNQDTKLTLPYAITVYDINWLSIYCSAANVNFGSVAIPFRTEIDVPPFIAGSTAPLPNCQRAHDTLNVHWAISGDRITIELEVALNRGSAIDGYVAFGLSGSSSSSSMNGADVAVAFFNNGPKVVDHFLSAYSQCSQGMGACPDTESSPAGTNSYTLISGTETNGIARIRFWRLLDTGNTASDKVWPNGNVYIVWASGLLNSAGQVTKHSLRIVGNAQWDFSRTPSTTTCTSITPLETQTIVPWPAQRLSGQDVQTFEMRIGPSGGDRGYSAITQNNAWGIAWWVNKRLIPEITLRRGETYTFRVQGGDNPVLGASYHPGYITNDANGGYVQKTNRDGILIFGGVTVNMSRVPANQRADITSKIAAGTDFGFYKDIPVDSIVPTVGPYCQLTETAGQPASMFQDSTTYGNSLQDSCGSSTEGGTFTITPTAAWPNQVFYQCYTHNYLGWRIKIVDAFASHAVINSISTMNIFLMFLLTALIKLF